MSLADSFMSKMAKLDNNLQRGLDNGFAFIFGGHVVPAELEEMLKQEAQDNVVRTYEGDTEAPHLYRIGVSPKDFANLSRDDIDLPEKLSDLMSRFIRNKGWVVSEKIVVQLELDNNLRTGQLRPHTSFDSTQAQYSGFYPLDAVQALTSPPRPQPEIKEPRKDPAPQPATQLAPEISTPTHPPSLEKQPEVDMNMPQSNSHASTEYMPAQAARQRMAPQTGPTITLLLQDGSSRTYLVQQGRNLIGRGNDVDFRLPDTGVSRHHLEINWDGHDAVLTDLQSTNGTMVNDMPVENWLLADGDVITIGHSYIEVRITGGN